MTLKESHIKSFFLNKSMVELDMDVKWELDAAVELLKKLEDEEGERVEAAAKSMVIILKAETEVH